MEKNKIEEVVNAKVNVYSIYDCLAKSFDTVFTGVNNSTATRTFKFFCENHEAIAKDIELYHLGSFNLSTGDIALIPKELVARGSSFIGAEDE